MESLLSFATCQPQWLEMWQRMITDQRCHHACLFLGSARGSINAFVEQLTALLLCQAPQDWQPCRVCPSCLAYRHHDHPDRIHMSSSSHGEEEILGMDQIRQCQQQLRFAPQWAPRRIAIVSPCERLSGPAQHALLKTLEEPLPTTMLFLLSPSRQDVLPTVYSRCLPLHWQPPPLDIRQGILQDWGLPPLAALMLSPIWQEAAPWSHPEQPQAVALIQLGHMLPTLLQARTWSEQAHTLQQLLQTSCPWPLVLDVLEAVLLALMRYQEGGLPHLSLDPWPMAQVTPEQLWKSLLQLEQIRRDQIFHLQPQACLEAIWLHCWSSTLPV